MIRLRDIRTGNAVEIPGGTAVEILDKQGGIALLITPSMQTDGLTLVTAKDEPILARNYSQCYNVTFSALMAPDLDQLTHPSPTHIQT